MPKLIFSSEKMGSGATIRLDSGEEIMVSIAKVARYVFGNELKPGERWKRRLLTSR